MTMPVVFIHGAFCGGWAFDAFRAPFEAAGHTTHAPDLPFHGARPDLDALARTGVRDYAAAITAVVRDLPAPPVLVGHSMGGLVAQIVATRTPVAGLALLAPCAPWGVLPTTVEEHSATLGLALLGDYWMRPILPDYGIARHATLNRLDGAAARATFGQFVPESGRAVLETIQWWLDPTMATAAPAYRIDAPAIAIAGGADRVVPASTVVRIAKRFRSGQCLFREFPAMSHWLMGEPEAPQVAGAILEWMERTLGSAPPAIAPA